MTIETERTFAFSADAVYGAWVAEETLIAPVTRIEKDVRVGGHYRLYVEMEQGTSLMEAEYQVIEPGRKLSYSWEWNGDGEVTLVTVRFVPQGTGCVVHLTHSGFQLEESFERHASGWENYFDGLAEQLGCLEQ